MLLGLPPLPHRPQVCNRFAECLAIYILFLCIMRLLLCIHLSSSIMSQDDIDAFVESARYNKLTPEGVTTAVVTKGIPVNGRHSIFGWTALHWAVHLRRRELVVALLAAGADANAKGIHASTSVLWGATYSTADILQLLMDGGGYVNKVSILGQTALISLLMNNYGAVVAVRLQVLLACPHLDLDEEYEGKTAEQWAMDRGYSELAVMIVEERARRERWSALRASWIVALLPRRQRFVILHATTAVTHLDVDETSQPTESTQASTLE